MWFQDYLIILSHLPAFHLTNVDNLWRKERIWTLKTNVCGIKSSFSNRRWPLLVALVLLLWLLWSWGELHLQRYFVLYMKNYFSTFKDIILYLKNIFPHLQRYYFVFEKYLGELHLFCIWKMFDKLKIFNLQGTLVTFPLDKHQRPGDRLWIRINSK